MFYDPKLIGKIGFLLVVLFFVGCGGKSGSSRKSNTPDRKGETLSSIDPVFFDASPSLSQLGDRVVFLSGRSIENQETEESASIFKAYKVSLVKEDGTSQIYYDDVDVVPERLTKEEFGIEKKAFLFPNGKWVLLETLLEGKVHLIVQGFKSDYHAELMQDISIIGEAAFSEDSKMVSFEGVNVTTHENHLYLLEISDPSKTSSISFHDPVELSSANGKEKNPEWLPVGSGSTGKYVLITRSEDSITATSYFLKRAFSSYTSAPDVQPVVLVQNITSPEKVGFATANKKIFLARKVLPLGSRRVFGSTDLAVRSEPIFLDISKDKDNITSLADDAMSGSDVVTVSLNKGGNMGLWISRESFKCKDPNDENNLLVDRFGTTMLLEKNDFVEKDYILPISRDIPDSPRIWDVKTDYCDSKFGEEDGNLDYTVNFAGLNYLAEPGKGFIIVYVSWFTGDSEVRALLMKKDGTKVVYNLSKNESK